MRRAFALLLIPSLIVTSGVMPLLHTHAYSGHDHPEHHHGLAAHDHHAAAHPANGVAYLKGCDPGNHVVSFAFVCAAASQVHGVDAALNLLAALPTQDVRIDPALQHTDVRVHGPPPLPQASPRAPPLIVHI